MTMDWANVNIYFDEQAMAYHLDIYQEGQWIHPVIFQQWKKLNKKPFIFSKIDHPQQKPFDRFGRGAFVWLKY